MYKELAKYYDLIYDKPVLESEGIFSEKDTIKRAPADNIVNQKQKEELNPRVYICL